MQDLSLHILDIAENSIAAGATEIRIKIVEDSRKNLLVVEISDNGKGMDKKTVQKITDPFFTTKTVRKVGLGIPLLAQAARECCGDLTIKTEKGKGTTISACFQRDHVDRKPLGDIGNTMIVLIASNPEVDFIFEHRINDNIYTLNIADIRKELDGVPLNTPEVIKIIKDDISAWLITANNMLQ